MGKILVIDDEKPTLAMFRFTLSAYGYSVLTAENGQEGLEVFQRERPPVVLTDIKMPGMDGIEVLRRIKQIEPLAEVIVITGHGDMDLAIKALNLDATDFINKPVQQQALKQALSRAHERILLAKSGENQASVQMRENGTVVRIKGNLSSHSEASLKSAIHEAFSIGTERIVLSFDPSASINGAGMALLTEIVLEAQKQGRQLVIAGLSDNLQRVLKIVGVSKLVKVYDSEETALSC